MNVAPADSDSVKTPLKISLCLGALGVVFGDIGTSPLYTMRECLHYLPNVDRAEGVIGILSLMFWSLLFAVNVKYLAFVTKADNRGEGGIFALLALSHKSGGEPVRRGLGFSTILILIGAALLYGDGIITPAISVLGAAEGMSSFNPGLAGYVVPISVIILALLFFFQRKGTQAIGGVFGPVILVWFGTLGVFGAIHLFDSPEVFRALNPIYGLRLLFDHPAQAAPVLGGIVLTITGAEALYADMGHFGIKPIRMGWYLLVGPALVITYFGQGAAVLVHLEESGGTIADGFNPFYALIPKSLLYPMVCMAAMATVIASQAMISGVFSLARQAIRLSMLPRLEIVHTSGEQEGQIYLPALNGILLVGCLFTVLLFPSSSQLANAYGIAVTLNMLVTTIIFSVVARRFWRWRRRYVLVVVGAFLVIDVLLAGSNFIKVVSGGWFTLAIALFAFVVMTTWVQGSFIVGRKLAEETQSIHDFLAKLWTEAIPRVPGTAVFLTTNYNTPLALRHFVEHAHVLHEQVVLMTIVSSNLPVVPAARQVRVEWLPDGVWKITALCGFMESPNIPRLLERARQYGFSFDPEQTTYFARRTSVVPSGDAKMAGWRKRLYSMLARNSADATRSFNLPPDRVVDFGAQVEL
jgi:KUP system potassium uptake protein